MELLLLIPLIPLIVSDWKNRHVLIWNILLFAVMQIIICLNNNGFARTSYNMLLNTLTGIIIALMTGVYFKLRGKLQKELIGWGDILFILCLTPAFSVRSFLIFMILSFVSTLIIWLMLKLWRKISGSIPLVSGMGLCYAVWLCIHVFE
ncbi:MAG: hypothetical protein AB2L24_23825 [Mangrovibacterium sp.]